MWLTGNGHTPRTHFTNKSVTKSPNENIAHPLCGWKKTHCGAIGKGWFSYARGVDGPTHISPARADTPSGNIYSAFHIQIGRKPPQRAYQNEKCENYPVVSKFRNEGLCSSYPMISSQPKRTQPCAEISLEGTDTSGMTYLIPQCQQIIVEKDDGGRIRIILDVFPYFELHERRDRCPPSLRF